MSKYITLELLWTLYCVFLEANFPKASKPELRQFCSIIKHELETEWIDACLDYQKHDDAQDKLDVTYSDKLQEMSNAHKR